MRSINRRTFIVTAMLCAGVRISEAASAKKDATTLALSQAARRTDSFPTETQAYSWLEKMSRRLRFQLPNPFYRIELLRLIHLEATRSGIAPELVMGLIQVESSFNRYAVSNRGARGLMQLMPFWMKEIGHPTDDLFNPATNLKYGCIVLKHYLRRTNGHVDRALGMYNGSTATTRYAVRVKHAMQSFVLG